jgi:hypothetical protein
LFDWWEHGWAMKAQGTWDLLADKMMLNKVTLIALFEVEGKLEIEVVSRTA